VPGEISEAYVALRFAAENLGREIQAKVRAAMAGVDQPRVTANVDADTGGAERKIDSLGRKVDELGRERPVIQVDADTGRAAVAIGALGVGIAALNAQARFLGNLGELLQLQALVAALGPATAGMSALAGAAAALVAQAAPLVGLLPGIAAGAGAIAQAGGVIAGAFSGIGGALKAYRTQQDAAARSTGAGARSAQTAARAQETAGRAIERALRGVDDARRAAADTAEASNRRIAEAERNLARAQAAAVDAQEALSRARRQATEDLEDLTLAVQRANLNEARAAQNLEDARRRVAELGGWADLFGDDPRWQADMADAELDLADAELSLREAMERRGDEQARLNEFNRTGIEGSERVVAAQRDVAEANERVADTQRSLGDAHAAGARAQEEAARRISDALASVEDAQRSMAVATERAATAGAASVDRFAQAMEGLSPAAQAFVRTLLTFEAPIRRLRDIAAENMFPGLTRGLVAVMPLFGLAEPLVAATARVIGDLGARTGELLASPFFQGAFVQLGTANVGIIRTLGEATFNLLTPLAQLVLAGAPLAQRLADLALRGSEVVASFIDAQTASGGLARFMDQAWAAAERLWGIARPLALILYDVGRAAFDTGVWIAESLGRSLDTLRDKTASVAGQRGLRDFFESMRPALRELAGLVGDFASMLGRVATDNMPKLAPLIRQVREEFLPALGKLIDAGVEHGPRFISFFSQVAEALGNLPIGPFIDGVTLLLGAFNRLMENPVVRWLVEFAILLVNPFTKVTGLAGAVGNLSVWLGRLGGAFDLIGPVIERVGGFFGGLMGRIGDLAGFVGSLPGRVAGPVRQVGDFFGDLAGRVGGFMGNMARGVGDRVGDVVGFFAGLPGRIIGAMGDIGRRMFDVGFGIVRAIGDGLRDALGWLLEQAGNLVERVRDRLEFWRSPPEAYGAWLGRNLVGGFAEGLADPAATRAATALVRNVQGVLSGLNAPNVGTGGVTVPFGPLGAPAAPARAPITNYFTINTIPHDPYDLAAVLDREAAWQGAA